MADKIELGKVENGTWECVDGVWRQVHGSFPIKGMSIEWHDFRVAEDLKWGRSFHSKSLEICLNYGGGGLMGGGKAAAEVKGGEVAIYTTGERALAAGRSAESIHRFLTFEFSAEFLQGQFAGVMDGLKAEVRRFIDRPEGDPVVVDIDGLSSHLLMMREHILNPPVSDSALSLWYSGKCTELMASLLFEPGRCGELFCHQHQRVNRELCERILFLLERDMENPPSLELLAGELGRSPFYLSRTFSAITGQTIPGALRAIRMNRAARLLRDASKPVTEVAFEVGYSSLGAFNKAFSERFGQSPSVFRRSIK